MIFWHKVALFLILILIVLLVCLIVLLLIMYNVFCFFSSDPLFGPSTRATRNHRLRPMFSSISAGFQFISLFHYCLARFVTAAACHRIGHRARGHRHHPAATTLQSTDRGIRRWGKQRGQRDVLWQAATSPAGLA